MTIAYWMILAAALVPYIGTAYAKFSGGGGKTYDNSAPRAGVESLPPARKRAYWAQLNGFEAFPPFAAGVIVASINGATQSCIDALAVTFVALRIAYTLLYIHDKPSARSLVWAAALACVVGLFVAAATASLHNG
jgi:uncharacterized MAPEG superfamily protein